jgi:hypothetical protein
MPKGRRSSRKNVLHGKGRDEHAPVDAERERYLLGVTPRSLLTVLRQGASKRQTHLRKSSAKPFTSFGITTDDELATARGWLVDVLDALHIALQVGDLKALGALRDSALKCTGSRSAREVVSRSGRGKLVSAPAPGSVA